MTINSVVKSWAESQSGYSSEDGKTIKLEFSTGYTVTHTYDTSEVEILTATGLPRVGDLYEGTFAICKKVGPVSKAGPFMSIVLVSYDGEAGPNGLNDNPLNKAPEYTWSDVTTSEPIDQDWDGRPIVTANGEPINGITMELADQTLTINKNFALFSPWITHKYRHSVNSDVFASYPAGTARMVGFSATNENANGFSYWKVNAKIQFRFPYNVLPEFAWYARARHEGFLERPASSSVLSFSGGGGTGAFAVPIINSSGVITAVRVIERGSGYTSNPTVSVSIGTGATFTVTRSGNRIQSVAVTGGGSGYKGRVVRAVDGNGEPTSKPVLLKADGTRELNPDSCYWVLVKRYQPLPYSALGLI
jgi:hypothetical protein